jgi:spore coat polysaccharide biosynthesis protein SpsF
MPLAGKHLIIRMLERVRKSALVGDIVLAITKESADDILVNLGEKEGFKIYRGSTNDLLDRHYKAGLHFGADAVVKIPSDCPLIDPEIITKVITRFISYKDRYDYVSNLHPATYPDGNDVEIMSMEVLEKAWKEAIKNFEREHTTPYLWENPELFRIGNVEWETGLDYSMTHRWTIDYMEDYLFIKEIYDSLYYTNHDFGLNDILKYVDTHSGIKDINQKYNGVNWYRNHLGELKTIKSDQTKVI